MTFGLEEKTIEKIISAFEQNSKVDKAYIFGSRAKGNYRPDSDIDIALKGQELKHGDLISLGVKLEDQNIGLRVDLLNYVSLQEPALVEHIDRVGVEVYSRWKEVELGDVCLKIGSGATPTGGSQAYIGSGISLIRSQNVLDLSFGYEGLAFISETQAFALKNVTVLENDILLNITGDSVARVCLVPRAALPARVNQHVAILRPREQVLNNYFLLYQLKAKKEKLLILSEIGGTRNALTKVMIQDFKIDLPPISEQIAIATILTNLDNKIDLLNRQNKTLEKLAETVFRQWFVEESEESWELLNIGRFVKTNQKSINKNYTFHEIEYLDTGSLTEGVVSETQNILLKDAPSRAKRLVQSNDILISTVRPDQKHYGLIDNPAENLVVSTGFCVITCVKINPYFVYLLLTSSEMTQYLHSIAEGSTSTYPSLKPSDIEKIEFAKPPEDLLNKFGELASGYWTKINQNQKQIQSLTKTRDNLLPKLMSGEVRVSELNSTKN